MGRSLASSTPSSSSLWMQHLPLVLLGLRSTVREDAGCCPSDVVFGCQLRLPGDLLQPSDPAQPGDLAPFVADLRASMSSLRPLLPVRRSARPIDNVPASLAKTSHVFLRVDAVRKLLTPPYDGPFPVLQRGPKTFQILKNNKMTVVSIDRLKPAFSDLLPRALPPAAVPPPPAPALQPPPAPAVRSAPSPASPVLHTRSGRIVRRPVRFN